MRDIFYLSNVYHFLNISLGDIVNYPTLLKPRNYRIINFCRSESPISSRSSPSISPGCEDPSESTIIHHQLGYPADFKKPIPSQLRHTDFPHAMYANYPYHLMPGGSAFHRPMDGKTIPVSFLLVKITKLQ